MRVRELRGEIHLANEPLAQQPGGQLGIEHFDRDAAMRVFFDGEVNASHSANADLAFDVIVGSEGFAERV